MLTPRDSSVGLEPQFASREVESLKMSDHTRTKADLPGSLWICRA